MSAPAAAPPTCRACGKVFNLRQLMLSFEERDYLGDEEGVLCKHQAACRARQMHAKFDDLGLQWSRHTGDQLLHTMDLPPENAPKDWESIFEIEDRLLAGSEFYSTCYPVCLWFACQTDAKGEPIKEFGEWKPHTSRSLAAVFGVHQSTIVRAIQYWESRNRLRWEEGRVYFEPAPKPILGVGVRQQLLSRCTRISESNLKDLAALLPSTRKLLVELFAKIPNEECARIRGVAVDACARLNLDISDARARASKAVIDACNGHLSLLSRTPLREDFKKKESERAILPVREHIELPPEETLARSPENPSSKVNGKTPEPPAPPPAIPHSDPDEAPILEAVEAAWGGKLKPNDEIPGELLAISRNLGFPVRVLQVWIGAFANEKTAKGYPIESPRLFVHAVERDLPVWAKANRLLVENAAREANRAEAFAEQRRESRIAQLFGVVDDFLHGPLTGYGNLADIEAARPALETLAATLQGDVTEWSLYALAQLNDLERRHSYSKLMPREFGGPRWLSVLLPLVQEFNARGKTRGAGQ